MLIFEVLRAISDFLDNFEFRALGEEKAIEVCSLPKVKIGLKLRLVLSPDPIA